MELVHRLDDLELEPELKSALEVLVSVHLTVWVHFDEQAKSLKDMGEKSQPKAVRKALKEIRNELGKHGFVFEGFERGE